DETHAAVSAQGECPADSASTADPDSGNDNTTFGRDADQESTASGTFAVEKMAQSPDVSSDESDEPGLCAADSGSNRADSDRTVVDVEADEEAERLFTLPIDLRNLDINLRDSRSYDAICESGNSDDTESTAGLTAAADDSGAAEETLSAESTIVAESDPGEFSDQSRQTTGDLSTESSLSESDESDDASGVCESEAAEPEVYHPRLLDEARERVRASPPVILRAAAGAERMLPGTTASQAGRRSSVQRMNIAVSAESDSVENSDPGSAESRDSSKQGGHSGFRTLFTRLRASKVRR
ncbi:MAG: hypothetical protein KDA89_14940, partial [Planctomycetaceae bacterium]|nr:hypothetical protein [Planctomycetaceae bacterium]